MQIRTRSVSHFAATTAVATITALCQCSSVDSGSTSRAGGSALVGTTAQAIVTANNTITQAADEARTGWYPDQANLSPGVVADPTKFGPIFSPVVLPLTPGEQVVAQPLVSADQKSVLVVTEQNNAYVLDAATGAINAKRAFGTAFNAQTMVTPGCGDLVSIHAGQGGIGITGTPVIDVATNTAYFVTKSVDANQNVSVTFRGVDATTLVDRFANDVHDAAQRVTTHGNLDGRPSVNDLLTSNKTLGTIHGNCTDGVLAQMGRDLKD